VVEVPVNTAPDPVYTHTARNVVDLGKGPFPARLHPYGDQWYMVLAPSPETGKPHEYARHGSELILRRND
jgi:hypothetical protein